MSSTTTKITAEDTVNDVVRQHPATLPIFNEFGIDSCCGGGVALAVAAARDGVDLQVLLARLNAAADKS